MTTIKRLATALGLAGLLLLPLAGSALAADDTDARVRVLHASPDAPAVDVQLDGEPVDALTNVPFGVISDYLPVPAGDHQVAVYPTGTTEDPVIDAAVTVEAGTAYTIAAINPLASIEATVIVDDPAPTASGAQLRAVHLSPDAPAVDIAPDGGDPVVSNLAFPDPTDYLTLEPGEYDLEIRPAGTTDVALQLDPLTLEAGRAYTAFAIGSAAAEPLGGNELQVLVAVDATAGPPAPGTHTEDPVAEPAGSSFAWALMIAGGIALLVAVLVARRRPDTTA